MNDLTSLITQLDQLQIQGLYGQIAQRIEELPPQQKFNPNLVLRQLRALFLQGKVGEAYEALQQAPIDTYAPEYQSIFELERVSLMIFKECAIREALALGGEIFQRINPSFWDKGLYVEAEQIWNRIRLTAGIYFELDRKAAKEALEELPVLVQKFSQEGMDREAAVAQFTYVLRQTEEEKKIREIERFLQSVHANIRPDLAAESFLLKGELNWKNGSSVEEIEAELSQAESLYKQIGHNHGLIDLDRLRVKIAISRNPQEVHKLEAFQAQYQQIDFPKGTINILLDLSQMAHEAGIVSAAIDYRSQSIKLAEELGMGLLKDNYALAQVDLLIRNANFAQAIDTCKQGLAANPTRFMQAGFKQLMATAYSFVDDYESAIKYGEESIDLYQTLEAKDSASQAILKWANDVNATANEHTKEQAIHRLRKWIDYDLRSEEIASAVSKQELVAQIYLSRVYVNPLGKEASTWLEKAEKELIEAQMHAGNISIGKEKALRIGSLHQMQGQLAQAKGNEAGVIQAWQHAQEVYAKNGLDLYEANCAYLLGILYLNKTNQDLQSHFGKSESLLSKAMEFYDAAFMRSQSADTRYMIAQLYYNASLKVNREFGDKMRQAALEHLEAGESQYDAIRWEYAVESISVSQKGKLGLIKKSRRLYELIITLYYHFYSDGEAFWNWVQRAKARGTADIYGMGIPTLQKMAQPLKAQPEVYALIERELELMGQRKNVPPNKRDNLEKELDELYQKMREVPLLTDYLHTRFGSPVTIEDVDRLFQPTSSYVCVDWYINKDAIFILVKRPGEEVYVEKLAMTRSEVEKFLQAYMGNPGFRSTLRDNPQLLRKLDGLLIPLSFTTKPEETLLISPSGLLHNVPLHALHLDGKPLILRNPISYQISLNMIRLCRARKVNLAETPRWALVGNPSEDRPLGEAVIERIASTVNATPLIGKEVQTAPFLEKLQTSDILYFLGHAVHDLANPLDSFLMLADKKFTARELFEFPHLQADLVVLTACESGSNVIEVGDEPLGIIPAFLFAGANSVVATLWRVSQKSSALFLERFHKELYENSHKLTKAEALRNAVLAVRETKGFESPYHWAPYILHGDFLPSFSTD
ncbi:MAG: CHAT domain-containing protein [Bacteroidota bacterium]